MHCPRFSTAAIYMSGRYYKPVVAERSSKPARHLRLWLAFNITNYHNTVVAHLTAHQSFIFDIFLHISKFSIDFYNSNNSSSILLTCVPSNFISSKLACIKQAPSLLTEPELNSYLMWQSSYRTLCYDIYLNFNYW